MTGFVYAVRLSSRKMAVVRRNALMVSILSVCLGQAVGGRHALGAETSAAVSEAEAHIQKGIDLRRQNRDTEALAEFQKAESLAPSARTRGQIGLALMAVGQFEAAEKSLSQTLSASSQDPWVVAHRSALTGALDKIQGLLGTLNVSGEPAGATVEVNGNAAGTLPCSLHVQSGDAALRVLAPGYLPILRVVSVGARQISNQVFTLVRISSDQPGATTSTAISGKAALPRKPKETAMEGSSSGSPWPWVAGGAGVLALGFGIFEATQWSSKASDFNTRKDSQGNLACGNGEPNNGGPGCTDLLHDGQTARLLSIGGLTVGAALGVVSWVLFSRDSASDKGNTGASGSMRPQALSCGPTPGLTSIVCSARF